MKCSIVFEARLAKRVLHPSKNVPLIIRRRWKQAILLPHVLNTLQAFVRRSGRQCSRLVCNRWRIVEPTFCTQKSCFFSCSVCVFHPCVYAWLPAGIAHSTNSWCFLKNVAGDLHGGNIVKPSCLLVCRSCCTGQSSFWQWDYCRVFAYGRNETAFWEAFLSAVDY